MLCEATYSMLFWKGVSLLLLLNSVLSTSQGNRTEQPPTFVGTERNVTVSPGGRAILICQVQNLGTKTVTWRREGEDHPLTIGRATFVPDTRIAVDNNLRTNEWKLIIQDVRPTDEGVYHCQIPTKHQPQITFDIRLNVDTVQVTGTKFVERGNLIKLTCNATGKPEPPHNVDWFKDGFPLESDGKNGIIITKKIEAKVLVSMLVINECDTEDEGSYICRSSNNDYGELEVAVISAGNEPRQGESRATQTPVRNAAGLLCAHSSKTIGTVILYVFLCVSLL